MKDLKVIFMGTPDFAVPILKMLNENTDVVGVVTQPDKEVGRKKEKTFSPVKKYALENNLKVLQPAKIDIEDISNIKCDIIITCAYGQILNSKILEYPRLGCINVHASLLPKYRGGAPIHWCLINGEEKTGITIMYMDKGMDSGDIIKQEEYLITDSDTVSTLHDKLSEIGSKLLLDTLPSIINKTNERIKQDENLVTYGYNITREDERLDFNQTGKEIINKIRGLNSWPLANFLLNDLEYKVLEAYFVKNEVKEVNKIIDIKKDSIGISCKDGIIYLTKIKPFGKKVMDVKSYLNGTDKSILQNAKIN